MKFGKSGKAAIQKMKEEKKEEEQLV